MLKRPTGEMSIRCFAVFFFFILTCGEAFSCTCMGPFEAKSVREAAEWYASRPGVFLVFEGKVIRQELRTGSLGGPSTAMSMTTSGKHRVVEFDIKRTFRGPHLTHASIVTGSGAGDCGFVFWPGESYLVYASSLPGGVWFTSLCSGTNAVEDSASAIRFLSGERPVAEDLLPPSEYQEQFYKKVLPTRTGSLCGQVLKPNGSPLKGASVELWESRNDDLPSRGGTDPNTSSDSGHFCIENVSPGEYFLSAEEADYDHTARYVGFYPGVRAQADAIEVSIEKNVRSPDVKFATFREMLYTISISILAPDKTQLSYKNGCGVAVDSEERNPLSYHVSHTLEEDGTYTFGYIPPGKYIVTTYFQPSFEAGKLKLFAEASRWKPTRQEIVVRGDSKVVVHMDLANPD